MARICAVILGLGYVVVITYQVYAFFHYLDLAIDGYHRMWLNCTGLGDQGYEPKVKQSNDVRASFPHLPFDKANRLPDFDGRQPLNQMKKSTYQQDQVYGFPQSDGYAHEENIGAQQVKQIQRKENEWPEQDYQHQKNSNSQIPQANHFASLKHSLLENPQRHTANLQEMHMEKALPKPAPLEQPPFQMLPKIKQVNREKAMQDHKSDNKDGVLTTPALPFFSHSPPTPPPTTSTTTTTTESGLRHKNLATANDHQHLQKKKDKSYEQQEFIYPQNQQNKENYNHDIQQQYNAEHLQQNLRDESNEKQSIRPKHARMNIENNHSTPEELTGHLQQNNKDDHNENHSDERQNVQYLLRERRGFQHRELREAVDDFQSDQDETVDQENGSNRAQPQTKSFDQQGGTKDTQYMQLRTGATQRRKQPFINDECDDTNKFIFPKLGLAGQFIAGMGMAICAYLSWRVLVIPNETALHLVLAATGTLILGFVSAVSWARGMVKGSFEDDWQFWPYIACFMYLPVSILPLMYAAPERERILRMRRAPEHRMTEAEWLRWQRVQSRRDQLDHLIEAAGGGDVIYQPGEDGSWRISRWASTECVNDRDGGANLPRAPANSRSSTFNSATGDANPAPPPTGRAEQDTLMVIPGNSPVAGRMGIPSGNPLVGRHTSKLTVMTRDEMRDEAAAFADSHAPTVRVRGETYTNSPGNPQDSNPSSQDTSQDSQTTAKKRATSEMTSSDSVSPTSTSRLLGELEKSTSPRHENKTPSPQKGAKSDLDDDSTSDESSPLLVNENRDNGKTNYGGTYSPK